ncbi:MAG: hypothetical protein AAGG07_00015 [Planctomycetota bacterium]
MSQTDAAVRLYADGADELMAAEQFADRVSLLPGARGALGEGRSRLRVLWGQDMLADVVDGRYRAVICGVNDADNSHGIIAQLVSLVRTSQWSAESVTSFAKMFQESAVLHAKGDREPYILKFDLDRVLVLGMLRPKGRDHFTLQDLSSGFRTIHKMLEGRHERLPVSSVSFLGGRSNRLLDQSGREPSFESVLHTMHDAGFRGDVYPSPQMWSHGSIGVFPTYPFPEGLERMRGGSS